MVIGGGYPDRNTASIHHEDKNNSGTPCHGGCRQEAVGSLGVAPQRSSGWLHSCGTPKPPKHTAICPFRCQQGPDQLA